MVTGYFFGRAPAERRAENAEAASRRSVDTAETHAQQAAASNAAKEQAERSQVSTAAELNAFKQETLATLSAAKRRMTPTVQRATTLSAGQGLASVDKENLIAVVNRPGFVGGGGY